MKNPFMVLLPTGKATSIMPTRRITKMLTPFGANCVALAQLLTPSAMAARGCQSHTILCMKLLTTLNTFQVGV